MRSVPSIRPQRSHGQACSVSRYQRRSFYARVRDRDQCAPVTPASSAHPGPHRTRTEWSSSPRERLRPGPTWNPGASALLTGQRVLPLTVRGWQSRSTVSPCRILGVKRRRHTSTPRESTGEDKARHSGADGRRHQDDRRRRPGRLCFPCIYRPIPGRHFSHCRRQRSPAYCALGGTHPLLDINPGRREFGYAGFTPAA